MDIAVVLGSMQEIDRRRNEKNLPGTGLSLKKRLYYAFNLPSIFEILVVHTDELIPLEGLHRVHQDAWSGTSEQAYFCNASGSVSCGR